MRWFGIFLFAVVIISCGSAAINGLMPGEERTTATVTPITTPKPSERPEQAEFGLTKSFSGVVDKAVTIEPGTKVVFHDNDPPVFKKDVTIQPGASLIGAATFAAKLTVAGKSGNSVFWSVPAGTKVEVLDVDLDWLVFKGEMSVLNKDKALTLIRNSEFVDAKVTVAGLMYSRLEVELCNFHRSELWLHPSQDQGDSDPTPQIIVDNTNFVASAVGLINYEEDFRRVAVTANNFYDHHGYGGLIIDANDEVLLQAWRIFLNNNYFEDLDRFARTDDWEDRYQHDLLLSPISSPFLAGPGANHRRRSQTEGRSEPSFYLEGSMGIVTEEAVVDIDGGSITALDGYLWSSAITDMVQTSFAKGIHGFSYDSTKGIVRTYGRMDLGEGCVDVDDRWYWLCEPNYEIKFHITVSVTSTSLGEDSEGEFVISSAQEFHHTISRRFLSANLPQIESELQATGLAIAQLVTRLPEVQAIGIETPFY